MGKVTAIYPYRDESGSLVAEKLRKEPGFGGAKKSFSWRRPLPPELRDRHGVKPDEEAWVWGIEEGTYAPHVGNVRDWRIVYGATSDPCAQKFPYVPLPLYNLPVLLQLPPETPVAIVEGEGKANLLTELNLLGICGAWGASSWNGQHAYHFTGRKVIVFPDNNTPGYCHAEHVSGSLLMAGAKAVKIIQPGKHWPIDPNEDVKDWLLKFPPAQRKAELAALLARFPAYSVGSVTAPKVVSNGPQSPTL